MLKQISALKNHLTAGRFGVPGEAGVIMEEVEGFGLYQLAAWPGTLERTGVVAAESACVPAAPGASRLVANENTLLLRVEPLKWWLLSMSSSGPGTPPALSLEQGCLLDLSHSRTWIRITGDRAEVLLNHFLPLDLRPGSFPQDAVASTAFHHIGITLWRSGAEFNLMLPRSFAASLWELLHESARQYGLEVR